MMTLTCNRHAACFLPSGTFASIVAPPPFLFVRFSLTQSLLLLPLYCLPHCSDDDDIDPEHLQQLEQQLQQKAAVS
jgi:hypothetical protein